MGGPTGKSTFEEVPLTRQEYINVLIHFYRGESHRAMLWRQRLDATTNWAVLTTAGVLSYSFADRSHEPVILLLSALLIMAYLFIEARRYRYYEVYRARVRMLEENFLLPIITRKLDSPMETWREMVAMDLDKPKFKRTWLEAVGFRLQQNFLFMFFILLGGWIVKLMMHPTYAGSLGEFYQRMAVGWIPSWGIILTLVGFYGGLVYLAWNVRRSHAGLPADEIAGIERDRGMWKL